jgi:transcriptional regulator with XRE-family HTH domain
MNCCQNDVALLATPRYNVGMTKQQRDSLGEVLRHLREQAGLSVRALSAASGVDIANISRTERGEATPKRDSLLRLAKALNVDPADLLTLAGYATGEALPSFTPYLRTKYGHLPAAKRRELSEFFERIEAEYGTKAKVSTKKARKGSERAT